MDYLDLMEIVENLDECNKQAKKEITIKIPFSLRELHELLKIEKILIDNPSLLTQMAEVKTWQELAQTSIIIDTVNVIKSEYPTIISNSELEKQLDKLKSSIEDSENILKNKE